MKNVKLIYLSPGGTTRRVAKEIRKHLESHNFKVFEFDLKGNSFSDLQDLDYTQFKDADLIGIGSPIYKWGILKPVKLFLKYLSHNSDEDKNPQSAFTFVTYGKVSSGTGLYKLAKELNKNEFDILAGLKITAPHFFESNNDWISEQKEQIIKEYVVTILSRLKSPIAWKDMKKKLKYQPLWIRLSQPFVNSRLGDIIMPQIEINKEKCKLCKTCISVCPTDAISFNGKPKIEGNCINCYNCVLNCPYDAFEADMQKMKNFVKNMRSKITESPEDQIF